MSLRYLKLSVPKLDLPFFHHHSSPTLSTPFFLFQFQSEFIVWHCRPESWGLIFMLINLKFWIIPYLKSLMDSLAHFLLFDSNFITAFIFLSFIACIFIYKTKQNKKNRKSHSSCHVSLVLKMVPPLPKACRMWSILCSIDKRLLGFVYHWPG